METLFGHGPSMIVAPLVYGAWIWLLGAIYSKHLNSVEHDTLLLRQFVLAYAFAVSTVVLMLALITCAV
jgi:hypothetical protein